MEINSLQATLEAIQRQLAATAAPLPRRKSKVKPKKSARSLTDQYLTRDEFDELIRQIKIAPVRYAGHRERDLAIFYLAARRGLRACEVGRLQIADFRPDAKRLRVHRAKGGNSAEYPLTAEEFKAVKQWITVRGVRPGPLFPSRAGTAISTSTLDDLIRQYGQFLPVPKRHFHSLRHTAGTNAADAGVGLNEIADLLGHRDVRNSARYARITERRRTDYSTAIEAELRRR
jgi:integrase